MTTVLSDTIVPGAGAPLGLVSDAELRECLRQAEREMRQAYSRMLDVVAEVDQRGMAQAEGFRDCAAMMSRVLRISTAEARDRVEHAAQCVARRSPAGVPLPVQMPVATEALRTGKLGVGQLRVITTALDQLGPQASPELRERVEADLVSYAETFEPRRLALIARRIRGRLDPDGAAPPEPEPMAGACGELRLRARRDEGLGLEGWLDNHVVHWAEGGATCLDNCILLCPAHHREVHHINWGIRIHPDRVEFTPPAILDPDRRPLINTYWH